MLKRIALALDTTPASAAAMRMARDLAASSGAEIIAHAIRDLPLPPVSMPADLHAGALQDVVLSSASVREALEETRRRARAALEELGKELDRECRRLDVRATHTVHTKPPGDLLAEVGKTVDITVMGTRTQFGWRAPFDRRLPLALIREGSSPLLLVPPSEPVSTRILFPYDGSAAAARAMRMFAHQLTDVLGKRHVTLLTAAASEPEAERTADGAAGYLRCFGHEVDVEPTSREREDAVHDIMDAMRPFMIIVGASEHGRLHRLLFGSMTETLIEDSPSALYIA